MRCKKTGQLWGFGGFTGCRVDVTDLKIQLAHVVPTLTLLLRVSCAPMQRDPTWRAAPRPHKYSA